VDVTPAPTGAPRESRAAAGRVRTAEQRGGRRHPTDRV